MPLRLASSSDLAEATAQLLAAPRLAVDTEFHAERRYRPQLLLVQVHADGGDTWIFDPLERGVLAAVAPALLAKPWVVHSGAWDLRLLHDVLGGLPDRVDDVQIAFGLVTDAWPAALGAVVAEVLGVTLEKTQTLSDWSRRPLGPEQLAYAAADVALLPATWDAIAARATGRETAVAAACREARDAALGAEWVVRGEPWRELWGASTLAPDALAVAASLHAWREQVAEHENQPPRTILGDAVLLELARRRPADVGAITTDRRVSKSVARSHVPAILACIREPGPPPLLVSRGTPAWRRAAWLDLLGESLGASRRFSPRLVLPRVLVERAVLGGLSTRADVADLLGAWRDALVGDALWDAWRGSLRLVFGPADVTPEVFL